MKKTHIILDEDSFIIAKSGFKEQSHYNFILNILFKGDKKQADRFYRKTKGYNLTKIFCRYCQHRLKKITMNIECEVIEMRTRRVRSEHKTEYQPKIICINFKAIKK